MAKQLIIIRHAKSDWGNHDLRDFDRPLNKRGHSNAPEMAERLIKYQILPEHIISSPALRAFTTASYFATAWKIPVNAIAKEPAIYEANVKTLLSVVNHLSNEYTTVALFGHNPGLTDLVSYFDGHLDDLPTCGVVQLLFEVDSWMEITEGIGKVLLYDYPKNGDD